jgi:hypothetical protein
VADCPPDFPGCPAYAFVRPACRWDGDCDSGVCEWDGYCTATDQDDGSGWELLEDSERLARAIRRATARYKTAKRSSARTAQ